VAVTAFVVATSQGRGRGVPGAHWRFPAAAPSCPNAMPPSAASSEFAAAAGSTGHPLDNVTWSALSTCQAPFARGRGLARRFDPAYGRFAGLAEFGPAALDALAALLEPGEDVSVFPPDATLDPGPRFEVLYRKELVQMLGPQALPEPADGRRLEVLGPDDGPAMAALVRATEPGPWAERTRELGRFVGVKVQGRLVAMAGERLQVAGYREISGVCTDPAWRGQGLARDAMLAVGRAMLARGERPFLHVFASNAPAIALYEKLGFVQRAKPWVIGLRLR
jgi:ribosomal protein S18 acetylase RimI-like enzyme